MGLYQPLILGTNKETDKAEDISSLIAIFGKERVPKMSCGL